MNNHTGTTSWHDYQPGQGRIPDNVTHLRIGYLEYQQLLNGNALVPIEMPQRAFEDHLNLKQVQIYLPAVSKIGARSFCKCRGLEQAEFLTKTPRDERNEAQEEDRAHPSQLISIGYDAFRYCRNLKIMIGLEHAAESLQEIGRGAFGFCDSLVNVKIKLERLQSMGSIIFFKNIAMTMVDLSKATSLKELQDATFGNCTALTSIHLPPNLLQIHWGAFYGCSSLEEIHLPLKLQYIGKQAFEKCSNLKSIVLPSSLQQIGQCCFEDCHELSHVVLPSSRVQFLKTRPFPNNSCKSLSSLDLPNPVPCQQWPLVLEQFSMEGGVANVVGTIGNPKNRNTIVWNFLCRNMAQLFMENNAATMSRRRPAPQP